MNLYKSSTALLTAFLLIMGTASFTRAQSDDDQAKVQQHSGGIMTQMSRPKTFNTDSVSFKVLKSDSLIQNMDSLTKEDLKQLQNMPIKKRAIPHDPRAMVQKRMQKQTRYKTPPFAIRTRAGRENRVVVYVRNRTQKPFTDLSVTPDRLPEGWTSQPSERTISMLPAGNEQTVAFSLQAPSTHPQNVGFKLTIPDGVSIHWAARVAMPKAATGAQKKPEKFEAHENYPNPFNPTTTISYSLPQTMEVQLTIYNILGQKITTLVNGPQDAGVQNITWDASRMASGTYFYRIVAETAGGQRFVAEQKMVLVK